MPLCDLYADVWLQIIPFVSTVDLLNLRLANKALNEIISTDIIWKGIVHTRWFHIDDIPKDQFDSVESSYLEYFLHRSRLDKAFVARLKEINSSNDAEYVLSESSKIIQQADHEQIPALCGLRQASSLGLRFLSTNILNSIRRRMAVESMKVPFDGSDVEDFFYRLSYLDPAFDQLLPYRCTILEKITSEVRSRLQNEDYDKPPTMKVYAIVEVFLKVCSCQTNYDLVQDGYSESNAEELSILRVYAGESRGLLAVRYAIIQKVARIFNIKSHVTESFLMVEDASFNDGVALLFFKDNKAQFISLNYLRRLFPDPSVDPSFDKSIQLVRPDRFLDFANHTTQLTSRLERLTIDHNSFETFRQVYPKSKIPFYHSILELPSLYQNFNPEMRRYSLECFSFDSYISAFPFDLAIFHKNFQFNYPLQSGFLDFPYEDRYVLCTAEEVQMNLPEPKFVTGQVVFHPRYKTYGVVLCPIYEEALWTASGSRYSISYSVLTIKLLNSIWTAPYPVEAIDDDLLDFLSNFPLIGKYFERFDHEANRFTPNQHTEKRLRENYMINYFHE